MSGPAESGGGVGRCQRPDSARPVKSADPGARFGMVHAHGKGCAVRVGVVLDHRFQGQLTRPLRR